MPFQQWQLALKLANLQDFSGLEQWLWQPEQALWHTSAFFHRDKPQRMTIALHFFQLWKFVHICVCVCYIHRAAWDTCWIMLNEMQRKSVLSLYFPACLFTQSYFIWILLYFISCYLKLQSTLSYCGVYRGHLEIKWGEMKYTFRNITLTPPK